MAKKKKVPAKRSMAKAARADMMHQMPDGHEMPDKAMKHKGKMPMKKGKY